MTTLSLRDRRHQQAQKDRARLERQRDETLDKLARITVNLKTVRRSIERYERTPAPLAAKPTVPVNVEPPAPQPQAPAPAAIDRDVADALTAAIGHAPINPVKDNLDIPGFLRRGAAAQKAADTAVAEAIKAEQAERKTAKARGRIATLKAKQSGAMRAMPLTGKAALEKIRAG